MNTIVASLVVGGTVLVPAELPSPDKDECAIVSVDIERGSPTLIETTPPAESMRIIVYCGAEVPRGESGTRTVRQLKVIDVDLEQAEVLAEAAVELTENGDVFLGDG